MLIDLIFFVVAAMMTIPLIGGYYASTRGRSFILWFFICLFLPIISFIILLFLPDKSVPVDKELYELRLKLGLLGLKAEHPANHRLASSLSKNPIKSKINFAVQLAGAEALPLVDIYIDGESLKNLVTKAEMAFARKEKQPMLAGSYEGLPTHLVTPPAAHLMGEPHIFYSDRKGRTALLVCGKSGMTENWALMAKVEVFRRVVVWHDFRHHQKGHVWRYDHLQPLVFDRLQYEEALYEIAQYCLSR